MKMVECENVSMMFNLSTERVDNLKEYVIRAIKRQLRFREFWALQDISFSLDRGDSLGIVGLNGSGKSTLLKIIAGVLKPTRGTVKINGGVMPLIELGAGFDANLSARENVYLNGAVLGYSRAFMANRYQDIMDFSELHNFADVPLKNFSSGMVARLGFAIATMDQPDILILDEVLSVGDYQFQERSMSRTQFMLDNGATVLFVSHSAEEVKRICNKALWLENGKMRAYGDVDEVCEAYGKTYINDKDEE